MERDGIRFFLEESGIDAAFIEKDENLRYLSGFTGSDSFLLLTKGESYLLTDPRYTEQAEKEAKGFVVMNHGGKLSLLVAKLLAKAGAKTVGVEENFTWKRQQAFHEAMPDVALSFCNPDRLRMVKTKEELQKIREACRISDEGFRKTVPFIKAGKTEAELRSILECAMLEAGSEGKSFDTIVASGWRSACPHGTATDKVVEEGDLITFDFGAIYKGYHSDITRTVAVGHISDRQRFLYDKVLECLLHVESLMKAGVRASDTDAEARAFFRKWDLEQYFIHALGHSVGLEIHEAPVLAARDKTVLLPDMTETVEPGVYIPGTGGVRIEDTVAIEKEGISVYTLFPKTFLAV